MKEVNARKKNSLARKILQIFGMDRVFVQSTSIQEESVHINIPANHNYWKENETALLEAERKKAQALMERQRRPFLC